MHLEVSYSCEMCPFFKLIFEMLKNLFHVSLVGVSKLSCYWWHNSFGFVTCLSVTFKVPLVSMVTRVVRLLGWWLASIC